MSLLSAVLLGFYDVAKKEALKKNGVLEVLAVATALTAVILCPFLSLGSTADHAKLIAKAIIVSASWISGLEAVKLIPLTTASTIKATRPMIVVLFSIILFGERLNLVQWGGVFLVIISLYFLSRSSKSEGIDFKNNRGIFYMVISVLTGSGSALYDKHILKSLEPMFVQSWSNIYITLVLIAVIIWYRHARPERKTGFKWDWLLILIAVLITCADALYFFAIKQEGSMLSVISLIRRSSVIITFMAGAFLYKENNIRSKAVILVVLTAGMTMLMLGSSEKMLKKTETTVNMEKKYSTESFRISSGATLTVSCINHGSVVLDIDQEGKSCRIAVDPVADFYGQPVDYSSFHGCDVVLVTHEHSDHLDVKAIDEISKESVVIYGNKEAVEEAGKGTAMANGDSCTVVANGIGFTLKAVAAYNTTEGHTQFHPKGHCNGYVLDFDGYRIYVAGDTEVIDEMKNLGRIDLAFLPCNQPYTMTPEQCIEACRIIRPHTLIPYHYGETDLTPLVESLSESETSVLIHEELR
ncbi:MAG: EamA family transporter [Bacteroidales bacterium]|nr:EamA family transporter [Candidatus Cryptobacteroides equifaecalis]